MILGGHDTPFDLGRAHRFGRSAFLRQCRRRIRFGMRTCPDVIIKKPTNDMLTAGRLGSLPAAFLVPFSFLSRLVSATVRRPIDGFWMLPMAARGGNGLPVLFKWTPSDLSSPLASSSPFSSVLCSCLVLVDLSSIRNRYCSTKISSR